ncbi:hypothetical protein [Brevibacterium moorei]|uniref:hypothetical protein n=1 Tax=Brevibacterium moorei TaxID=2968457 RepID=UPI00211C6448|nr:hypothetical protein [Brevibacterium sp. 68QC2CO]MCQ9385111.1 hypothetical protein [Brevibacterium sp. 68QC2CO]
MGSTADLARQIYDLEQLVKGMANTPQLTSGKINGNLTFVDDDGNDLGSLGPGVGGAIAVEQRAPLPPPPVPTAPVLTEGVGVFNVQWDGRYADGASVIEDDGTEDSGEPLIDVNATENVNHLEIHARLVAGSSAPAEAPDYDDEGNELPASQADDEPIDGEDDTWVDDLDDGDDESPVSASADSDTFVGVLAASTHGGSFAVGPVSSRGTYEVWLVAVGHDKQESAASEIATVSVTVADISAELMGTWLKADEAMVSANGKNNVYYGDEPPEDAVLNDGDIWFGPENMPNIYDESKGEFVSARDERIQDVADAVASLEEDLQNIVVDGNGNVITWDPAAPPADYKGKPGDVWYQTKGNDITASFRWDGSNWLTFADERVNAVEKAQADLAKAVDKIEKRPDGTTIYWQAAQPAGKVKGDTWYKTSGQQIIGFWQYDGSKWTEQKLDPVSIPNLDAGKIQSGYLDAGRIKAGSITADKVLLGDTQNYATYDPTVPYVGTDGRVTVTESQGVRYLASTGVGGSQYLFIVDRVPSNPFKPGDQISINFDATVDVKVSLRVVMWVYPEGPDGSASGHASAGTSYMTIAPGPTANYSLTMTVPPAWSSRDDKSYRLGIVSANRQDIVAAGLKVRNVMVRKAVGSTLIEPGAITTEKIAAGAITAESGIVKSLNAGVLTSGYVDAARIKAGSITADKVLLGGTNIATPMTPETVGKDNAGIPEPWRGSSYMTVQTSNPAPGEKYSAKHKSVPGTGNTSIYGLVSSSSAMIPVTPGETYWISVWVYLDASTVGNFSMVDMRVYEYPGYIGNQGAMSNLLGGRINPKDMPLKKWVEVGGLYKVRADTHLISPRLTIYYPDGVATDPQDAVWYYGSYRVERGVGSTLIAPGSVTTEHIKAGAITAESGIIGSIDAGKITAGQMDGKRIRANTIATEQLAAGAVTANVLSADSLNGKTITGSTIRTNSGFPRIELNPQGLIAFDKDAKTTFSIDQATGGVEMVGTLYSSRSKTRTVAIDNNLFDGLDMGWTQGEGAGIRMGDLTTGNNLSIYSIWGKKSPGSSTKSCEATILGPFSSAGEAKGSITFNPDGDIAIRSWGKFIGYNEDSQTDKEGDSTATGILMDGDGIQATTSCREKDRAALYIQARGVYESTPYASLVAYNEHEGEAGRVTVRNGSAELWGRSSARVGASRLDSFSAVIDFTSASDGITTMTQDRVSIESRSTTVFDAICNSGNANSIFTRYYMGSDYRGWIGSPTGIPDGDFAIGAQGPNRTLRLMGNGTSGTEFCVGADGKPRIWSASIYSRTYSGQSDLCITSAGTLGRRTSARKYKLDEQSIELDSYEDALLSIEPKTWTDKAEAEDYEAMLHCMADGTLTDDKHTDIPRRIGPPPRYVGAIADDFADAGLELLVQRGEDGDVEGLSYDRIAPLLIPIIRKQRDQIAALEDKVAALAA